MAPRPGPERLPEPDAEFLGTILASNSFAWSNVPARLYSRGPYRTVLHLVFFYHKVLPLMEVESGHCVLAYQTPFLPLAACAQELSKVSRNACGPFYKLRRYGSGQIPRRRLLEFACHLDALDQIDDESGINQVGPS